MSPTTEVVTRLRIAVGRGGGKGAVGGRLASGLCSAWSSCGDDRSGWVGGTAATSYIENTAFKPQQPAQPSRTEDLRRARDGGSGRWGLSAVSSDVRCGGSAAETILRSFLARRLKQIPPPPSSWMFRQAEEGQGCAQMCAMAAMPPAQSPQ